jgi:hypothetical protein
MTDEQTAKELGITVTSLKILRELDCIAEELGYGIKRDTDAMEAAIERARALILSNAPRKELQKEYNYWKRELRSYGDDPHILKEMQRTLAEAKAAGIEIRK